MESWNPYHDTELYFDAPSPLCQSQILDAREMLGSATGHYQARTVRPSMQYFDCDLSFTEPLRTHKVLPEGLCIVQMFDGQWRHSVDGGEPYLYNLGGPSVLGTGEPMEAFDILPAGSRVRLGGLRIAASYLEEELETGDGALRPLARLKGDGASFTQLSRCGAITALFERLYQNPYRGALGRLHEESLTLGLLVELAAYLGGADLRRARTPRAQRDLAHEARRLLEANLGEPPASLELARQLGVGETTLRRIGVMPR